MANKLSGILTTDAAPRVTKSQAQEEMKWRAEEDLRTLTKAAEIQRDRSRMAQAKKCAKDQIKSLSSVTGKKK